MIDTIILSFSGSKYKPALGAWNSNETKRISNQGNPRKSIVHHRIFTIGNGTMIKCKYIPHPWRKKDQDFIEPLLIIEVSVPKAIFGNNYLMIFDFDKAIGELNQIISRIDGLPPIDVHEGILRRLDVCFNYYVGDYVQAYIEAISHLLIPRREYSRHSTSVEFKSGQISTIFYDKLAECDNPLAKGLLRHEVKYQKQALKELTRRKYGPRLMDINIPFIVRTLESNLKQLGLFETSIGTRDTTFFKLRKTYSITKAYRLYGYIAEKNIGLTLQMSPRQKRAYAAMESRYRKDLQKAGIPPTFAFENEPLPILHVDVEKAKVHQAELLQNCNELTSITNHKTKVTPKVFGVACDTETGNYSMDKNKLRMPGSLPTTFDDVIAQLIFITKQTVRIAPAAFQ